MHITDDDLRDASILVVDDSMMSLREMQTILEEHGFDDVRTLSDPTKVIEAHRVHDFALIILDYYMPGMTGEEVLDRLNAEFSSERLNVLFWTSASEDELYTRALRKGARDVLKKENAREEEIVTRIGNLLESQLLFRQLQHQNEKLNEKVKRRTEQLERTSLETIGRVARAAEFRDNETGGHIQRIGLLASELAERLGIEESICDAIRYAAPMHDVGKLRVADEVLFKPGSLNEEEWEQMKEHTTAGARILSGADQHYLKLAKNIALYHHENWNGEGYPEGLEAGQIPIEARITAVCDVFDAVLSDRPYKDPWTEDRALNLIREEKGEQFDPDVASCFLENAEVMIDIRNTLNETEDTTRAVMPELNAS